mmetsp:Transcript_17473/g.30795  ORF Transcript_17473/g.30795 Transcript_17473/m.30795 type:complete len:818 (-) Transcript_17473:75-2528(-)
MKRSLEKRAAEEAGDANAPATATSSTGTVPNEAKKSKKQRFNPIKRDLPKSTCPPEVLVHKNRELAMLLKRLRRQLKNTKERLIGAEREKETAGSIISATNRAMAMFTQGALELLDKSPKVTLEANTEIPDKSSEDILQALFGSDVHDHLLKMITAAVPDAVPEENTERGSAQKQDVKPDEVEEGAKVPLEDPLKHLPALAEQEFSKHIKAMLGVLRALVESAVLDPTDDMRAHTISRLFGKDGASIKAEDRNLKVKAAAYADRIQVLESTTRTLRHRLEDETSKKNVILRRLAAVCNEALSGQEIAELAEKMGFTTPGKGAASSAASSAANSAGDGSNAGTGSDSAQASGEDAKVAEERLSEINKLVEEKKGLIDELEKLRASVSPLTGKGNEALEEHELVQQIALLRAETELARNDSQSAAALAAEATQALQEASKAASDAALTREKEVADSINERDEKINTLRTKLDAARAELKDLGNSAEVVNQYKSLLAAGQARITKLEGDVKRLEDAPPAVVLRSKLEELAAKTWPGDTDKSKLALLEADLEAAKKTLEEAKSFEDEILTDLEAVSNELETMRQKSASILEESQEKDTEIKRWKGRVLDMNENVTKLHNELKVIKKEAESERNMRVQSDAQFDALKAQYNDALQAIARTEQIVGETQKALASSTEEKRTLQFSVKAFDATKTQYESRLNSLQESNAAFRKEKEDAMYEKSRAEEDRRKARRALEKLRSAPQESGDLRLDNMENALRCPLRSEFWKDAIIIKCCHMFSKKALLDNLAKRNRNCPTCKHKYNKEDIKDIYLYQKNEYDEEDET